MRLRCVHVGYALTMQQGLSALRVLGIDEDVFRLGVASSEHVSYDKEGGLLGVYGPRSKALRGGSPLDRSFTHSRFEESEKAEGQQERQERGPLEQQHRGLCLRSK